MNQTQNTLPKRLTVKLEGYGPTVLMDNHYVTSGGEGHVYRIKNTIVKLYIDPGKMVHEHIPDKIRTLSAIRHPYIITPQGMVTDQADKPIGFHMKAVDGEPLTRLFTNSFRNQFGFTDENASKLVEGMREVVRTAHAHQAIMVDPNEMNWLAVLSGSDGPEPRAIDVDSWAIGSWPPRAVMLSIRDWHTQGFTELSDWFAWGIVTFQIYTGIHPYQGGLSGYKRDELERRMRENASVFHADIRLNRAVRDFGCIPSRLLEWYEAIFHRGERSVPPSPYDVGGRTPKAAITKRVLLGQAGRVSHDALYRGTDRAVRIFPDGATLLRSGRLIALRDGSLIGSGVRPDAEVVRKDDGWLVGEKTRTGVQLRFLKNGTEEQLDYPISCHGIFRFENRLFLTGERGITEIALTKLGRTVVSAGKTWSTMPKATTWYEGVGVQDAFGAVFLILPFGEKSCAHVRARELDGKKVVAGRAGERYVKLVIIDDGGTYRKYEFAFDARYVNYSFWEGSSEQAESNVAILPRGVCATIEKDGELTIFVPRNGDVRQIPDGGVSTDMTLFRWGEQVVYIRDGSVWRMKLK